MDDDRNAKRGGDGIDRDVVVGRADAAGGEAIVVAPRSALTASTIALLVSATTRTSVEPDALDVEPGADLGDIAVLGSSRQDLVADDD